MSIRGAELVMRHLEVQGCAMSSVCQVRMLRKAMPMSGPVLIDAPVDYNHNKALGEQMLSQALV